MRVIYIAGNGRSGSTLLDMMLGSGEHNFSAGELTFITREGISQEYCSCGATIGECWVWRKVMELWSSSLSISSARYQILRKRYERNKSLPKLIFNIVWPGKDFLTYCAATQSLFEAIQNVTKARVIIDSSKSASRILILRRFSDLTVIHLCRNFTGVMNSVNKFSPKNIEEGIEEDIHITPPWRALINWILNNFLVSILSVGIRRHRIHYGQMVRNTNDVISTLGDEFQVPTEGGFSADHMLAGNVVRLRKNVAVDSGVGFRYANLSNRQLLFGELIDTIFWYWARK